MMFNVLLICCWDYIDFNFNETTSKGARCRCHFFFSMLYFLRLCWCPINAMPNATSEESPSGNRREDCGSTVQNPFLVLQTSLGFRA